MKLHTYKLHLVFLLVLGLSILQPTTVLSQCITPSANDTIVCGPGAYEITVDGGNGYYRWYDAATGGNYLANGNKYTTLPISSNTTYYPASYATVTRNDNLILDGTDDYLAIQNMNYSGTSYTELTVETWIRTTDGTDQVIASFDRSEYWRLEINGDGGGTGQIGFDVNTDAGILDFGSVSTVNDGNWHHIAAVFNNGVVTIFIDGVQDGTTTSGTTFGSTNTRYGFIGTGSEAPTYNGATGPNNYFNGEIDEIRIWNVARTQTEILASMSSCISNFGSELDLNYPFNEASGSTVGDYSINSNDGAFQNIDPLTAWQLNHPLSNCESGCESTRDPLLVTVDILPKPYLGEDNCLPAATTLDAGAGYSSYLWSTGAITQTIPVTTSGFYSVIVDSNNTSCQGTDGISLSILLEPEGIDTFRCGPGSIELSVDNPGSSDYYWYDQAVGGSLVGSGSTFTTPSLSASTSYYVSVIDNLPSDEALNMDGTDDYVAIDNMDYFGSNYNEVTVEAWVRIPNGDVGDHIIASFDRSEYWRLEINGTGAGPGQIGFDIMTDAGQLDFGSTSTINDGNWHHIAAVFKNGDAYIYIDGLLDISVNMGTKFGSGIQRYGFIGVGSEAPTFDGTKTPLDYFGGDIDEVRIWSIARNISEIQSNKDNCLSGAEANLMAYYKMEDGTGSSTLTDHSNHGRNGTLFNMNTTTAWINTGQAIDCSCGESERDTVDAAIDAVPVVNLGNDTCAAAAFSLNAGSGFLSYLWQDNSTASTITASTSRLYWVHVTDAGTRCIGGDSIVVSIGNIAAPTAVDSARCGGGNVTLKASSPETIKWWDLPTGGTLLGSGETYTTGNLTMNTTYYMTANAESTDALNFDGDDYAAISNKNYSTAGAIPTLTVEAWIRTSFTGGAYDNWSIVDFDRSEYFNFYINGATGVVSFSTTDNSATTDDFGGVTVVNDGNWHHVAAVYDGTNKMVYVDGVLDATKANPHGGLPLGSGAFVRYGFLGDGSEATAYNGTRNNYYYTGDLDEIRIWNTVRTQTEINSAKSTCLVGNETGLEVYYKMDDASGTTITDYSGNNNATIFGATWINTGQPFICSTCGESARTPIQATVWSEISSLNYTVSCPGQSGTVITLQTTGGSGNYDYEEMNGIFNYSGVYTSSTLTKTLLNGGIYDFKTIDEHGCVDSVLNVRSSNIPTQIATTDGVSSGCNVPQKNDWFYVLDGSSKAILAIKSTGSDLGLVNANVYVDADASSYDKHAYMNRHFVVQTQNAPSPNVDVRLYFTTAEYNELVDSANATVTVFDDISSKTDIGTTKYEGPTEDDVFDPSDATSLEFIPQNSNSTEFGSNYIEFTTASFSEFWLHASQFSTPLPIELLSFDAKKADEVVIANWVTASEMNNDFFTVQRSIDGANFEDIATVKGAGNSSELNYYTSTDDSPLPGISYYRLKQTDFDGQFTYSQPVAVEFLGKEIEASLSIFPNPASGNFNVNLNGFNKSEKIEIRIHTISGQLVLDKSINVDQNGNRSIKIEELNQLPKGVYFINCVGNEIILTEKLILK